MSFSAAVYDAVRVRHPDEARAATHEVVARELARLDPGVAIEATPYFNHTFVPDLILRWGKDKHEVQRDVYLRLSVSSPSFQQQVSRLGVTGAIFLSVFDEQELPEGWVPESARPSASPLITQAVAVERLDGDIAEDSRTRVATRELIRDGHGTIDAPRASAFGGDYRAALRAIDSLSAVSEGSEIEAAGSVEQTLVTLQRYLGETGLMELEQTLHSLWIRNGGDPERFPGKEGWDPARLSKEALQRILLDLLESGQEFADDVWRRLAGHISAEDIGGVLGRPIYGASFNRMATALLPHWTTQWVWADVRGDSLLEESMAWFISDGILGLDLGDVLLHFADDGRHFKDKPRDFALPTLAQTQDLLDDVDVQGVALHTTTDNLLYRLRSGQSSVKQRIREILAEPDSSQYLVESLSVRVPDHDHLATVSFERRNIDYEKKPTPLRTAVDMSFRFFSRLQAERAYGLSHFLATGQHADGSAQR
jgi:hypothetical protein